MKIVAKNSSLVFTTSIMLPVNTELWNMNCHVATGYYSKTSNVGSTPLWQNTKGSSYGENWKTVWVPVRKNVTYKFKVSYCIPNASHALIDKDNKLIQLFIIPEDNSSKFKEYTEFTPPEDGYMAIQHTTSSTISVINTVECKAAIDWGTNLPTDKA